MKKKQGTVGLVCVFLRVGISVLYSKQKHQQRKIYCAKECKFHSLFIFFLRLRNAASSSTDFLPFFFSTPRARENFPLLSGSCLFTSLCNLYNRQREVRRQPLPPPSILRSVRKGKNSQLFSNLKWKGSNFPFFGNLKRKKRLWKMKMKLK